MRILILADASSPHAERWVRGFESLGHEVTIASFQEPSQPIFRMIPLRGKGRAKYWMAGPEIRRLSEEHDAVLAHFLPAYGVSAWRAGVPFAMVLWGSDILTWPFRDGIRFGIAKAVLASASWAIADSFTVRRVLQLNFGYPPERVSVFPFGPDEDALRFPQTQKHENQVIFPRALESIYSPKVAIKALGALSERGHGLRILFTMPGAMAKECEALAKKLGIFAEFKGPLARQDYLMSMASSGIYLSLALSDATPVSLLEAMALGAFPIVPDLPAMREWVLDGVNGFLVDPRSPESVAQALENALRGRELVENARALNRHLIQGLGPWIDNLAKLSDLLAGLRDINLPRMGRSKKGMFWSYL
ncbi:MAG: glycosyltransferase family 4 protein [candidate division WOR-3 bacterium]